MANRDDDIDEERPRRHEQRHRYDNDEDDIKPTMRLSRNQLLSFLGLIIVISFFVTMIWGNFSLVSKSAYGIDITSIVGDIGKVQNGITTLQGSIGSISDINNKVSQISDKVTKQSEEVASVKSSLNDYAKAGSLSQTNTNLTTTQNTLSSLQSQVNSVKQVDTSGLSASIDDLKKQLDAMEVRLLVLEQGGGAAGSGYNPLSVEVKTIANTLSLSQSTSTSGATTTTTNTLTGSLRLAITNTSKLDITDAMLDVSFDFSPIISSLSYGTGVSMSLTGGSVPFSVVMADPSMLEFYNTAWGFKVPANQTTNLFLTLSISYSVGRDNNTTAYNPLGWQGTYYYQVMANASS